MCSKRVLCSKCGVLVSLACCIVLGMFSYLRTRPGGVLGPSGPPVNFNITYARRVLDALCSLYRSGRVAGDYCNRLCFFGNYTILDLFAENKLVLLLMIGGQKVVLKSVHPFFGEFEQLPSELSQQDFEAKVLEMTNYHLGLGWPEQRVKHLVRMLWPAARRSPALSAADKKSLWTLVSQEEYLTFSVLSLARIFPQVMGSCGHFYAVEHIVPFKLKSYYTNLKAKILVHMMGTLKLFYEFLNEPLHWCDVKFENFGLSADYPKRFLIMDADMIFTETRMQKLLPGLGCRSDADCHFFDCVGVCNATTSHCSARINDNVDVFCRKLVVQLFGSFWTKSNRYLAACHDPKLSQRQRLQELRLVWAWSLPDV